MFKTDKFTFFFRNGLSDFIENLIRIGGSTTDDGYFAYLFAVTKIRNNCGRYNISYSAGEKMIVKNNKVFQNSQCGPVPKKSTSKV